MQGLSSERIEGLEPDKVSVGDMQQFVRLCADAIHSLAPTQPATVGSARRKWLPYWTTVGLGLYQFHWYDKFQPEELFPFPPAGELGLDKPILIGEVPTSEAQLSDGRQVAGTRYKAGEFLEAARAGGYGGLLFWSFRAADQESDVGRAAVDLMSRVPRFFSAGTRNAASFQNRLAANMLGTLLGENLAQAPLSAPWLPPPTRLGSTSVTVTDSSGRQESAPLLFASPTQIYLLMPDLTATGQGTLTVDRLDGFPSAAAIRLDPVAPGLFSLDADGSGVAAATAVCVAANGSQTAPPVFRCGTSPRSCVPVPIDLGDEGTRCQLTFYGTGIRGRGSPAVVGATIGGSAVPILYAGPQAQISGLDQVNLEIPRSLVGRGLVDVVVVADGVASNAVTIQLR